MFFNKPKAQYSILNDNDEDVYNLFNVIRTRYDEFKKALEDTPVHEKIFNNWENNDEDDPVWRAVRFVYLSNFSFKGKGATFRSSAGNSKKITLENAEKTKEFLQDLSISFTCSDFRKALKSISFGDDKDIFIYADPPYLGTANNYKSGFKKQDFEDLLDILISTGAKFAVSEFDNKTVIEEAVKRGLVINYIEERRTIGNRNVEILITNYRPYPSLF